MAGAVAHRSAWCVTECCLCKVCCSCGDDAGHATPREEAQQLILSFEQALPQPTAALYLTFQYSLKEGLAGFYRCAVHLPMQCAADSRQTCM